MGVAGRKPKPAALRLLEGNREHRPIKEPIKVPPTLPKTPPHLKGPALIEWKAKIEQMGKVPGWLADTDNAMLAGYCICHGSVVRLTNHIEEQGGEAAYIETCITNFYQAKHILERDKAMKELKSFASELGFSPTSRGRVEPTGKEGIDRDEDLD